MEKDKFIISDDALSTYETKKKKNNVNFNKLASMFFIYIS